MKTYVCGCGNAVPILPETEGMTFPCPKCGTPITIPSSSAPPGPRRKPFGQIAQEMQLVTSEQRRFAVEQQRQVTKSGKRVFIGEVMRRWSLITPGGVRGVLKEQGKLIFRCPGCGSGYNVSGLGAEPVGRRRGLSGLQGVVRAVPVREAGRREARGGPAREHAPAAGGRGRARGSAQEGGD